ncbi:MAG TPA: VIT1/CCC1 transporter family protein [Methylomirabilota bacterium]|jgi:VIT1/CCC1 family predicted Fe2+/Mn2+ transporter/rubrerythrin
MAPHAQGRTDANLHVALAGEADANRRYVAYGMQALQEGHPEVAELFFEAAGAETVHALTHLRTMGAIRSTRENLEVAARGEVQEIEVTLPRMIREAEEEGRQDAAASFRLALERERYHRDMFRAALARLAATAASAMRGAAPGRETTLAGDAIPAPETAPGREATPGRDTAPLLDAASGRDAPALTAPLRTRDGRAHVRELATEPKRIERLSSIREVVFGAQDGLVSTSAVVAGLAAAGADHLVVLLAGAVSAVAGILAMSIGTFVSSRAQRQLYEAELARERREIREHAGEEIAELIAALTARGMSRGDAVEVARRIARHPELLLATLSTFELGLAPQRLGSPVRDSLVMGIAFGLFAAVPLLPFVLSDVIRALALSALLTVAALFFVGALKGRLGRVSAVRSGLEVATLGVASGLIAFGLGRLASVALGVEIG